MKPTFLLIGAARCGTSSFCAQLAQHPEIFFSDPKEPFFFSHDDIYARGMQWYEALFEQAGDAKAVGEGSTTYTKHIQFPHAAERIAATLPDARLIYLVRNPLEQIASHYMVLRSHRANSLRYEGGVSDSFQQSVRESPVLIDAACYWNQINLYRQHFDDRQILVLFFEDYTDAPQETLRRAFQFLGVDTEVPAAEERRTRHSSNALLEDRSAWRPITDSSLAQFVRRRAPNGLKSFIRPVVKRRLGERPEFDDSTRSWVLSQICEDAEQFLQFYGRTGLWDLKV